MQIWWRRAKSSDQAAGTIIDNSIAGMEKRKSKVVRTIKEMNCAFQWP